VVIFDWDVHHGNGVAALVEDDPRIRYCSIHEEGNFPNTGSASDTGKSGHNNLLHVPLPAGSGWAEYEAVLSSQVLPWLAQFQPDLVVVSAGFDALAADHLANQRLTPTDFGSMSRMLRRAFSSKRGQAGASSSAGVEECRIVLGLEGGYSLDPSEGLPEAIAQTVMAFAEDSDDGDLHDGSDVER